MFEKYKATQTHNTEREQSCEETSATTNWTIQNHMNQSCELVINLCGHSQRFLWVSEFTCLCFIGAECGFACQISGHLRFVWASARGLPKIFSKTQPNISL